MGRLPKLPRKNVTWTFQSSLAFLIPFLNYPWCFCLSQVKNLTKDFKEVQVKPHEYYLSHINTSLAKLLSLRINEID
jgi:hypothetical protein